jgi:hypothetical protein
MPEEKERREISPAVAIIPVGLGLAALGVIAAMALGKPPVTPPEGAVFIYTSDLRRERTNAEDRWSVDVKNTGTTDRTCTLSVYSRMQIPGGITWSAFSLIETQSKAILPGETVTFTGTSWVGPYTYQLIVKSEAGTLLNPAEPKEFICSCCVAQGIVVSFATEEELEAHFASAHPEYEPMPRLDTFTLQGLSWPDHFYHWLNPTGEDLGRITMWRAVCLLDEADYEPAAGWRYEHLPTTGAALVPVEQALQFVMPENWVGAKRGPCGIIPNSTIIRLFFKTDLDVGGWLNDSPWFQRIPNEAAITFTVDSERARNWTVS